MQLWVFDRVRVYPSSQPGRVHRKKDRRDSKEEPPLQDGQHRPYNTEDEKDARQRQYYNFFNLSFYFRHGLETWAISCWSVPCRLRFGNRCKVNFVLLLDPRSTRAGRQVVLGARFRGNVLFRRLPCPRLALPRFGLFQHACLYYPGRLAILWHTDHKPRPRRVQSRQPTQAKGSEADQEHYSRQEQGLCLAQKGCIC